MHVIFIEPNFPRNQREFPRALKSVGAHVTGIGESPQHALDSELKGWLDNYEQVRSVTDTGAMYDAVKRIQSRGWVDRLEATVEAHIEPVAKVREAGTIRAANDGELERAIQDSGVAHGAAVAVEEFIEGHEGFYDTLSIEGRVVHDFACHYFPNVLEAMRTRWISPQILVTNRIGDSSYDEVKQ